MKKFLFTLISFFSVASFGQEKIYNFDKKISYKINTPDEYNQYLNGEQAFTLVNYVSKDALLGVIEGAGNFVKSFNQESLFIHNNKFFDVYTNSLDNKLLIKDPFYYNGISEEDPQPYKNNLFDSIVSIKNLNSTQIINSFKCNEYELTTSGLYNKEKKSTICIDENNSVDNVSIMFPQAKIKGLLIRLDTGDFNGLTIKNISNSNAKVSFDEKKEIDLFEEKFKKDKEKNSEIEIINENNNYTPDNRYDDPIINYYSYITTSKNINVNKYFKSIAALNYNLFYSNEHTNDHERAESLKIAKILTDSILKQLKKNKLTSKKELTELTDLFKKYFDDANKFEYKNNSKADSTNSTSNYTHNYVDYYDTYQSTYKTVDTGVIDLAIENSDVVDFLKAAPKFCKNLKNNIPTFSDKNLTNEVYNYLEQICDLYIYNSGYVGLKETINSLRKSNLEIYNKYKKLSKEDKNKLDNFLNSLD